MDILPDKQGNARRRLVMAALRVFAEKGFDGATTRDICEAAGANISAIRYYFGDKAGLYRAAFTEPMCDAPGHAHPDTYRALPLDQALQLFFKEFLDPLKRGEETRLAMRLRLREMLEPTGAWQEEIDVAIKPQHAALVGLLKQHLGLKRVDLDVQRLAFAIIGMAVHFHVGQDVVAALAPQMMNTPKAIDTLAERLAGYAQALIASEAKRRLPETPDENPPAL